jgi:hypothetical protein
VKRYCVTAISSLLCIFFQFYFLDSSSLFDFTLSASLLISFYSFSLQIISLGFIQHVCCLLWGKKQVSTEATGIWGGFFIFSFFLCGPIEDTATELEKTSTRFPIQLSYNIYLGNTGVCGIRHGVNYPRTGEKQTKPGTHIILLGIPR